MDISLFSLLPLWCIFLLAVIMIFSSIYVGLWMGKLSRKKSPSGEKPPIGTVTASLFGLLAFMLALTFNTTASRFEARKQLLLDEVNAISTAYLRADFLESIDKDLSRKLLLNYVQVRTNTLSETTTIQEVISHSKAIQKELWSIAKTYPKGDRKGPLTSSYIASLNEVFALHTSRVTVGITYQIHPMIWLTLVLVSSLSMSVIGFQFGYDCGRRASLCLVLATTFSLVLLLIVDLDRPAAGMITVDQSPMVALLHAIQPP